MLIMGKEYIYNHDLAWKHGIHDSINIERGVIVTDVEILQGGEYTFKFKGNNVIYHTHYGWSFIENTFENTLFSTK